MFIAPPLLARASTPPVSFSLPITVSLFHSASFFQFPFLAISLSSVRRQGREACCMGVFGFCCALETGRVIPLLPCRPDPHAVTMSCPRHTSCRSLSLLFFFGLHGAIAPSHTASSLVFCLSIHRSASGRRALCFFLVSFANVAAMRRNFLPFCSPTALSSSPLVLPRCVPSHAPLVRSPA